MEALHLHPHMALAHNIPSPWLTNRAMVLGHQMHMRTIRSLSLSKMQLL